jgi:hypothetical protein
MIIDVQGFDLTLTEVTASGGAGYYQGKGYVSVPYLGGATFNAVFSNLFIDENRKASSGRIDFVTRSIDNWVEEQLEQQRREELEEQQQENRDQWSGTDFHPDVIYYEKTAIKNMRVGGGSVIIEGEDEQGNPKEYTNDKIIELANSTGQAVIIEDKNGDQWVVQPGGKVSKVPGGGLSPNMDVYVSEEALDIVKQALIILSSDYSKKRMEEIERAMIDKRKILNAYKDNYNANRLIQSGINPKADPSAKAYDVEFYGFGPAEKSDKEEVNISEKEYQEIELDRNRGRIVGWITTPKAIDLMAEVMAPELKVETKTITEFIEQQKIQSASQSTIIEPIKESIKDVLDKFLKKKSRENLQYNTNQE